MIGKLCILAGLASLQATVFTRFRVGGGGPDFALVALVVWASQLRLRDALFLTFCSGLFLDLLSLLPTGTTALGLLPAVFSLEYWKVGLTRIGLPVLIPTVWLATVVKSFILLVVAAQVGYKVQTSHVVNITIIALLYNSFIVSFYFSYKYILTRSRSTSSTISVS